MRRGGDLVERGRALVEHASPQQGRRLNRGELILLRWLTDKRCVKAVQSLRRVVRDLAYRTRWPGQWLLRLPRIWSVLQLSGHSRGSRLVQAEACRWKLRRSIRTNAIIPLVAMKAAKDYHSECRVRTFPSHMLKDVADRQPIALRIIWPRSHWLRPRDQFSIKCVGPRATTIFRRAAQ